jgi:hypothetical protein
MAGFWKHFIKLKIQLDFKDGYTDIKIKILIFNFITGKMSIILGVFLEKKLLNGKFQLDFIDRQINRKIKNINI